VGLVYTQSLEVDEISGTEYLSFQVPRVLEGFSIHILQQGIKIAEKLIHENTIRMPAAYCSGNLFTRKRVVRMNQ
jgi:hypothetical protein